MRPRERLAALLAGDRPADPTAVDRPMVDIGSSTATGIRDRRARTGVGGRALVGHPVVQTRVLTASAAAAIGSDVVRAGLVASRPELDADETFLDPMGVRWLWADGEPTPLEHPLAADAQAPVDAPGMPDEIVAPDPATDLAVLADAPVAGLLEHCFALRGPWRFLQDVADDRGLVTRLLDGALAAAVEGYRRLLQALPAPPDLVLYTDELGYGESMFLDTAEFRTLVLPRLRELTAAIRDLTPAALVLRTPGAIAPLLPDLVGLGVEVLNLQHDARGMDPAQLRRTLPATTVLHGVTDLTALGRCIAVGDRGGVAQHAYQFARSWPVIAAPVDSLAVSELLDAVTGAVFLAALDGDGLGLLRRAGPVRAVVERGLAAVAATEIDLGPVIAGEPPDVTVRAVRTRG